MAFEQLDKFTDLMIEEYVRSKSTLYMCVLADYYSTVLKHPKFKSQRLYCEKKMWEVCESFCIGYFKPSKSKS